MAERYDRGAFEHGVMVDVGGSVGALIVYAPAEMSGQELEISQRGDDVNRVHAEFLRRTTASGPVCAAVFGSLSQGRYCLWRTDAAEPTEVEIIGGEVTEFHWR